MGEAADSLYDSIIIHDVDVMRFTESENERIGMLLRRLERDLVGKLTEIDPTSAAYDAVKTRRLVNLLKEVEPMVTDRYRGVAESHARILSKFAGLESRFTRAAITGAIGVDLSAVSLSAQQYRAISDSGTLIAGASTRDWWKRQDDELRMSFRRMMQMGLAQGEDLNSMITRVTGTREKMFADGLMHMPRRQASALVRSSLMSTMNYSREETCRENDDLVKGYMWVSTLDGRTTQTCILRDGREYSLDFEPIDHDVPWGMGPGRIHINCRSTSVPILKSWKELGVVRTGGRPSDVDSMFRLRLREMGFSEEQVQRAIMHGRASMDGVVPATKRYEDWLRDKPEPFQNRMLGLRKADLWRSGRLPLRSLYDASGYPMSLEVLEANIARLEGRLESVTARITAKKPWDAPIAAGSADDYAITGVRVGDSGVQKPRVFNGDASIQTVAGDMDRVQAKKSVQEALYDRLHADEDFLAIPRAWGGYPAAGHPPSSGATPGKIEISAAIKDLISNWADTSGDSNPLAITIQKAAQLEFGLSKSSIEHYAKTIVTEFDREALRDTERNFLPGIRKFLRAMYEETQEHYRRLGVTHLTVVRGFVPEEAISLASGQFARNAEVVLSPLSSFSEDIPTAMQFASRGSKSVLVFGRIPVERVIGTPLTGFGCLSEHEIVVLGASGSVDTMGVTMRGMASANWDVRMSEGADIILERMRSHAEGHPTKALIDREATLVSNVLEGTWNDRWIRPGSDIPDFDAFIASVSKSTPSINMISPQGMAAAKTKYLSSMDNAIETGAYSLRQIKWFGEHRKEIERWLKL